MFKFGGVIKAIGGFGGYAALLLQINPVIEGLNEPYKTFGRIGSTGVFVLSSYALGDALNDILWNAEKYETQKPKTK